MVASNKRRASRRLFLSLAGVTVLTLAVLALLVFRPRPTVVELKLAAQRVSFTVVPPTPALLPELAAAPDAPAPLTTVGLLDPTLQVSPLEVRRVERIAAVFAAGRAAIYPGEEGALRFTAPEPIAPELTLRGPARITLETSGRDRAGGARVLLWIAPQATAAPDGWSGRVPTGAGLTVDLRDVQLALAGTTVQVAEESYPVAPAAPDPVVTGGRGEARIGLTLPPREGPATLLRLLDPATGELSAPRRLPPITAEPRSLPWRERFVLLEPDPGDAAPLALLRADLRVRALELHQLVKLEAESFLAGGLLRFPGGEREPVEIAPRALLTLRADDPLTLRSLSLADGHLALVLWGKPASLRLGPTLELQAELLPSQFLWLYTHRLSALAYTTLVSVLGTSLGLFKLLAPTDD